MMRYNKILEDQLVLNVSIENNCQQILTQYL